MGASVPLRVFEPLRLWKAPLVVGTVVPTGADGVEMRRGSQLAVEQFNDRGGADGRLIELDIVEVDVLDDDSTLRGLTDLADRGVNVLTAGYFSNQHLVHNFVANWGVPYMHTSASTELSQFAASDPVRRQNFFQVCAPDDLYTPRFVQVMSQFRDLGSWAPSSDRLLLIMGASDFTDFGYVRAQTLAEKAGWILETVLPTGRSSEEIRAIAERVRSAEPAAIMIGFIFPAEAVAFIEEFLEGPSDTLLYLIYAPSIPEFRQRLGLRSESLVWATTTGTYSDHIGRHFASGYLHRFGQLPGRSHAGIAYDRTRMAAQAFLQTGGRRDVASIRSELRTMIWRGVNGVYFFGNPGQTALSYPFDTGDTSLAQASLVFKVQQGRDRIIDPVPYAESEFQPQPWLTRTAQEQSLSRG